MTMVVCDGLWNSLCKNNLHQWLCTDLIHMNCTNKNCGKIRTKQENELCEYEPCPHCKPVEVKKPELLGQLFEQLFKSIHPWCNTADQRTTCKTCGAATVVLARIIKMETKSRQFKVKENELTPAELQLFNEQRAKGQHPLYASEWIRISHVDYMQDSAIKTAQFWVKPPQADRIYGHENPGTGFFHAVGVVDENTKPEDGALEDCIECNPGQGHNDPDCPSMDINLTEYYANKNKKTFIPDVYIPDYGQEHDDDLKPEQESLGKLLREYPVRPGDIINGECVTCHIPLKAGKYHASCVKPSKDITDAVVTSCVAVEQDKGVEIPSGLKNSPPAGMSAAMGTTQALNVMMKEHPWKPGLLDASQLEQYYQKNKSEALVQMGISAPAEKPKQAEELPARNVDGDEIQVPTAEELDKHFVPLKTENLVNDGEGNWHTVTPDNYYDGTRLQGSKSSDPMLITEPDGFKDNYYDERTKPLMGVQLSKVKLSKEDVLLKDTMLKRIKKANKGANFIPTQRQVWDAVRLLDTYEFQQWLACTGLPTTTMIADEPYIP